MNDQYFGERPGILEFVESTDKDTNSPVVNSDPFTDKVPVDATLIHETPMGGTVAAVGPMEETVVPEAPVVETIPYQAPVRETTVDESASKPVTYPPPVVETVGHEAPVGTTGGSSAALLSHEESEHFRTRWNEIQGKFVDEPRAAVQQADALVSEVVEQITQMFANEHSTLESQWKQGNDVSTEDLRKALQRYRSFFNRLVV